MTDIVKYEVPILKRNTRNPNPQKGVNPGRNPKRSKPSPKPESLNGINGVRNAKRSKSGSKESRNLQNDQSQVEALKRVSPDLNPTERSKAEPETLKGANPGRRCKRSKPRPKPEGKNRGAN